MSSALNIRSREIYVDDNFVMSSTGYSTIQAVTKREEATCFVEFKNSSPHSFTLQMLSDLLDCAEANPQKHEREIRARVLASRRRGIFSLGGDLSFFRDCITSGEHDSLAGYARLAVELIWQSVTASSVEGMVSIALVQGEAQGGGFEAALASHILIAERGTWFGFPEGLFGLFPGMGARALLEARGAGSHASTIIGSAKRYSAEELHSMGIVDVLAEPGRGRESLNAFLTSTPNSGLEQFRGRFLDIKKRDLLDTVHEWADLAMRLSQKHLRTIDYLIQAQERARRKEPNVRVI